MTPPSGPDLPPPPPDRFPPALAPFRDPVPPTGSSLRPGHVPATRLRTGWPCRLAALAVVVAAPIAAWRVVGPNPGNEYRNDPSVPADHWDYMVRPPAWDPGLERAIGWGGVAVFLVAAAMVALAWYRGRFDAVWLAPLLIVTAVGLGAGVGQRVMTAAVVGANMGGGFVLLCLPAAAFLLGLAASRVVMVVRTTVVIGRP